MESVQRHPEFKPMWVWESEPTFHNSNLFVPCRKTKKI